ncbi:prepilin-type N-terminal cleavage/methylation domain-containing protein [Luteolibacter marinus]|uniref:prepilin-type N-terminal cleavage/methylation domain-containing protein n=1 Tax=Luteolibacter marinus TaxID=2776705 RepID=UPI001866889E|nr:prepilin-type N-terminal cleavage/methylation domain-containing protein [Luteolibacter marinus]
MKTRSHRRESRGFTLVELLVVISIIIVLAAMSFGGIQIAQNKVKGVQTKTAATALYNAIEQYYSEYSKLPDIGMQGDEMVTEGASGQELLTILLGKEEKGSEMENPRQIPFLTAQVTQIKKKGGLFYGRNTGQPEGLYDAWGNPFYVRFDDDYDDEIRDPFKQSNVIRNKKVIVYSYGKDGKLDGGDEITSWK